MPTSGCSLEPTATIGSSELLCLFLSESFTDIVAGFLSSLLPVLDTSTFGSLSVKAVALSPAVGTPGLRFLGTIGAFFCPTGGFFKGPGPTFLPPGTSLFALKRRWTGTFGFLDNVGLSESLALVPFIANFLLTRGFVLAVTAVEPLLGPVMPLTFTEAAMLSSSLLPCWSKTCTSGDGLNSWSLSPTSRPGAGVTCISKATVVTLGNVFPKDVEGVSI